MMIITANQIKPRPVFVYKRYLENKREDLMRAINV